MSELMASWVEVWPVAADEVGVWLLSGIDPWRPTLPVMADSEPHGEVEMELAGHCAAGAAGNRALEAAVMLHSTSWRVSGPRLILTYMAVIQCQDLVRTEWPDALPISLAVTDAVGKPFTHAPADAPTPRDIDVLMHGIRHLKFLAETDATNGAALDANWRRHLEHLKPALAGMYDEQHKPTNDDEDEQNQPE